MSELSLLIGLYVLNCILVFGRLWVSSIEQRHRRYFSEVMSRSLVQSVFSSERKLALDLKYPRFYERVFVRRLLLTYMLEVSAEGRHILFSIYREFGFFKKDLLRSRSRWWWVRLHAAVILHQIAQRESARVLRRLSRDPHPRVSKIARSARQFRAEKREWALPS